MDADSYINADTKSNLSWYLPAVCIGGLEQSLALRLFSLYRFILQSALHASHSPISPHSYPCYGPLVLSPPNYFISFKSVMLCSCRLRMRKYVSAALVPAWNGWNCWRLCRTAWWLNKAFKWTDCHREKRCLQWAHLKSKQYDSVTLQFSACCSIHFIANTKLHIAVSCNRRQKRYKGKPERNSIWYRVSV